MAIGVDVVHSCKLGRDLGVQTMREGAGDLAEDVKGHCRS